MTCVISIQNIQHIIMFHLALCTIDHFNSKETISSLKVLFNLWVLSCNCCHIDLTEMWAINASNVLASKTAVQVIFWVNLLGQYRSAEPCEAL